MMDNEYPNDIGIRFPEIEVQLTGGDSNAFAILAKVRKELIHSGLVSDAEVQEFMEEATKGDYDDLLNTCMNWVEVS